MDVGHEETRWPARVSQASVAEGGGPELKKGAAKQGTGQVLLLDSRSAHRNALWPGWGLRLPVGHTDPNNQLGHVQGLMNRTVF